MIRRLTLAGLLLAGCGGGGGGGESPAGGAVDGATLRVTSSSLSEGGSVPTDHTCDGRNVSPPLEWSGVPEGTAELSLELSDPDAPGGTFIHWSVTGIDASATGVGEGEVPRGGTEERNSFGRSGFGGPCPPSGDQPHRYIFTVRALDAAGALLAEGRLTTRYGR